MSFAIIVIDGNRRCEWGLRIALPDDRAHCVYAAVQEIRLYGPGVEPLQPFSLCARHAAIVCEETDPHGE